MANAILSGNTNPSKLTFNTSTQKFSVKTEGNTTEKFLVTYIYNGSTYKSNDVSVTQTPYMYKMKVFNTSIDGTEIESISNDGFYFTDTCYYTLSGLSFIFNTQIYNYNDELINTDLTISSDEDWFTFEKVYNNTTYTSTITATMSKNSKTTSRVCLLTLKTSSNSIFKMEIRQRGTSANESVDFNLPSQVKWFMSDFKSNINNFDDGLYYQFGSLTGYSANEATNYQSWSTSPFKSLSNFKSVSGTALNGNNYFHILKNDYDCVAKTTSYYRIPTKENWIELQNATNKKGVWHNNKPSYMYYLSNIIDGEKTERKIFFSTRENSFIPSTYYASSNLSDYHSGTDYYFTYGERYIYNGYELNLNPKIIVEQPNNLPITQNFKIRPLVAEYSIFLGKDDYEKGFQSYGGNTYYVFVDNNTTSRIIELNVYFGGTFGIKPSEVYKINNPIIDYVNTTSSWLKINVDSANNKITLTLEKNTNSTSRKTSFNIMYSVINVTVRVKQKGTNAYDAVDLGLPSGTKWAGWNIGATRDKEEGKYFQWGGVTGAYEPRTDASPLSKVYNWTTTPFNNGSSSYNQSYFASVSGSTCPNGVLSNTYDAAYKNIGSNWTLPTLEQINELKSNVTFVNEIKVNSTLGLLFTSNINGEEIFFPIYDYLVGDKHYQHASTSRGHTHYLSKTADSISLRYIDNRSFNTLNVDDTLQHQMISSDRESAQYGYLARGVTK